MEFNKKQKIVILLGIALIILTLFVFSFDFGNKSGKLTLNKEPDYQLMYTWFAAIVIIVIGLVIILKGEISWNWRNIIKRGVIILTSIIIIILSFIAINYILQTKKQKIPFVVPSGAPVIQTEFLGIKLGLSREDVKFLKGLPIEEDSNSYAYKGPANEGSYCVFFYNDKVVEISTLESMVALQGINEGTSLNKIVKKFGEPTRIDTSSDGLSRCYYYSQYNLTFAFSKGKVWSFGIYDPNWKPDW